MALRLGSSTCPSARFRPDGSSGEAGNGRRDGAAPSPRWRLLGAGCGAEEHANEPRPQPPTRVSVTVTPRRDHGAAAARSRSARNRRSRSPRTRTRAQPPVRSNAPLDVVFVAANLTDVDSRLELRGPARTSPPGRWSPTARHPAGQLPDRRLHDQRRRHPRRRSRSGSSSARTGPPPRTTLLLPVR